jgi:transposase
MIKLGYSVSVDTVSRIIKNYLENGDFNEKPRSGRPQKTTKKDQNMIIKACIKD